MKSLITRLLELETSHRAVGRSELTATQSQAWLAQEAKARGLNEDDVIQKHGGWPGFVHSLLHEPRAPTEWNDGMSAQERYMRMLDPQGITR